MKRAATQPGDAANARSVTDQAAPSSIPARGVAEPYVGHISGSTRMYTDKMLEASRRWDYCPTACPLVSIRG